MIVTDIYRWSDNFTSLKTDSVDAINVQGFIEDFLLEGGRTNGEGYHLGVWGFLDLKLLMTQTGAKIS